jgi:hypothetical protein
MREVSGESLRWRWFLRTAVGERRRMGVAGESGGDFAEAIL